MRERTGAGVRNLCEDVALLPTPVVNDMGAGKSVDEWDKWAARQKSADGRPAPHGKSLAIEAARRTEFGQYTAAVERWAAILDRPAPDPTTPGKDGRPRLSARFVEWMMGLPDGWVTGVGIAHGPQLKALGNGVVPQQAAHAIRLCMARLEQDNE
jgi:DNA (cytosine-5)-methyltransferase 1